MDKVLLITHDDLDGAACAVLANLAYNTKKEKRVDIQSFHTPKETEKYLLEECSPNFFSQYDMVYITDLCYDKEKLPCDINVKIYDHHEESEKIDDHHGFCTIKLNGRKTCGAELFYRYALLDCDFPHPMDYFIDLVREWDTWDWKKNHSTAAKELNMLFEAYGFEDFVSIYTRRFRENTPYRNTVFEDHEEFFLYVKEHEEELKRKKLVDNAVLVGDYIFININAADKASMIGDKALKRYPHGKIAVLFNLDARKVELRSRDIDLVGLAKDVFHGGGHKNAAGGTLMLPEADVYRSLTIYMDEYFKKHKEEKEEED